MSTITHDIDGTTDITNLPFWVDSRRVSYLAGSRPNEGDYVHLVATEDGYNDVAAYLTLNPEGQAEPFRSRIEVVGSRGDSDNPQYWTEAWEAVPAQYWPSTIHKHGPCVQQDVEDTLDKLIVEDIIALASGDSPCDYEIDFADPDEDAFRAAVEAEFERRAEDIPFDLGEARRAEVAKKLRPEFDALIAELRAEALAA